ncbi:hypothetical protein E2C01_030760 [Portunus trituberculatus]|uniref:Uncharacterized protein n=1 Tax=Portunus trituberculatus TaxID=210409 RepID=A0A5B7EVR9_PORTR|nr:hypothetical protein [Portunus trituberculatus]
MIVFPFRLTEVLACPLRRRYTHPNITSIATMTKGTAATTPDTIPTILLLRSWRPCDGSVCATPTRR